MLIVDCLTVWVANELHHGGSIDAQAVARALTDRGGPSVVITNEVGLGVHPETELGRSYRDELGRVNQAIAAVATRTLLLVAGRAIRLGDPWKELT
jgi:adenosyl cobinamide kinase/adenosyl cobinamide phosphate guanylyltransferase